MKEGSGTTDAVAGRGTTGGDGRDGTTHSGNPGDGRTIETIEMRHRRMSRRGGGVARVRTGDVRSREGRKAKTAGEAVDGEPYPDDPRGGRSEVGRCEMKVDTTEDHVTRLPEVKLAKKFAGLRRYASFLREAVALEELEAS